MLAERLAIVGDPRRGIGLDADGLPEIDWVPLAGGTVEIEGETFTVAPLSMARFPVTIAQFRAFVAECFRDGGTWQLPHGFSWPLKNGPPRHKGAHESHAADNVSWYDTQAFCQWLNARLHVHGRPAAIRLPTEAEWQLAATAGDPGRIYPWGADWDPLRANTFESGLKRTLPVGFYPGGASPDGILDMAGNLWEWCEDLDDAQAPERAPRVLRGGSWLNTQVNARSANRSGGSPDNRSNYFGFRVVCSSPSFGH